MDGPAKHSLYQTWPVTARLLQPALRWQWWTHPQNIALDFYEQTFCLWAAWLIICDFFWNFGCFVFLRWSKLTPGSFKAASYVGQVIFGFWFWFLFSHSLATVFLFPFVRIRLATVYGAKCSLLSPWSYLFFKDSYWTSQIAYFSEAAIFKNWTKHIDWKLASPGYIWSLLPYSPPASGLWSFSV